MNTEWIVGFVAYSGKETKIMMNSQVGRLKQSDIEKMMNKFTVYIVTMLLVMSIVLAIIGGFWHSEASSTTGDGNKPVHFYIEFGYDSIIEGFFTFIRYFQLLSLFLPTSLFVSVEVVKAFMAYFVSVDVQMYDPSRAITTKVRNLSILEDLGMISYVFADKTGTLTCNLMEFHSMCVGPVEFGPVESNAFPIQNASGRPQSPTKMEFNFDKLYDHMLGLNTTRTNLNLTLRTDN